MHHCLNHPDHAAAKPMQQQPYHGVATVDMQLTAAFITATYTTIEKLCLPANTLMPTLRATWGNLSLQVDLSLRPQHY
jgi:hypothetical protein